MTAARPASTVGAPPPPARVSLRDQLHAAAMELGAPNGHGQELAAAMESVVRRSGSAVLGFSSASLGVQGGLLAITRRQLFFGIASTGEVVGESLNSADHTEILSPDGLIVVFGDGSRVVFTDIGATGGSSVGHIRRIFEDAIGNLSASDSLSTRRARALEAGPAPVRRCSSCHAELGSDGARFCKHCGTDQAGRSRIQRGAFSSGQAGPRVPATRPRPVAEHTTSTELNPVAVGSTVAGAVSLLALPLNSALLWFLGWAAALALGFVARHQINHEGRPGRPYMIAGLTLGFISIGILVVALLFGLAALEILAKNAR